jgi:hypothetical protein
MTPDDLRAVWDGMNKELGDDPRKFTFGGFKRTGKDGTGPFRCVFFSHDLEQAKQDGRSHRQHSFHSDQDIIATLTNATEWVAGAFKARGEFSKGPFSTVSGKILTTVPSRNRHSGGHAHHRLRRDGRRPHQVALRFAQ